MTFSIYQTNLVQVQLPSFVENIRDKLAENIHEMWAMGKVESGWAWGERRDDAMGTHPCLTQFQNLPQEINVFCFDNNLFQ